MKNGMKLWHFIIGIVTLAVIIASSFYRVESMAIQTDRDFKEYKMEMKEKVQKYDGLSEDITEVRLNIILICKELNIEPEEFRK